MGLSTITFPPPSEKSTFWHLFEDYEENENFIASIGPGSLFANYSIIKKLGAGGQADVYLAADQINPRNVAIKIFRKLTRHCHEAHIRILRESNILRKLTHPNIVTILDTGAFKTLHYIAMEYIPGVGLEKLIHTGKLTPDENRIIARQVASGLFAAHELGIVHRDLKPGNVMIERNGHRQFQRAVLLDFGLAKPLGSNITQGFLGTPLYASPEQLRKETLNCSTDIFGLGLLFFELFTGVHPFIGQSSQEVTERILFAMPDMKRLARVTSEAFADLTRRMLAKTSCDRPKPDEVLRVIARL